MKTPTRFAVALQRDGDFGSGIGLAGQVIRIARDVGRVVHFAGGRDVSHHARANRETMTLAVNGTAANSGEYESWVLMIAKKKIDFDAAEGSGNFVHDTGDEFFNVESRGNTLGKFLQAHEFCELERRRFRERRTGKSEIRERAGRHDRTLLPIDYDPLNRMVRIRLPILFLFDFWLCRRTAA